MASKVLFIVFVFVCAECVIRVSGKKYDQWKSAILEDEDIMDVTDFSVYYDIKTNQTIKKMMPRPWYTPGWLLRLPFFGGPCKCDGLKCSCCTGIKIDRFDFDRKACTILTFEPSDAMLNMEVTMNGDRVYKNTFSAKNPPPFCVPIPIPYLPPGFVDLCVRLFDISIVDQRLHVCMDWDTRIDKAPVLVLHYDCMNMGLDGVSLSKPGGSSNQTNTASTPADGGSSEPTQVDSDIYDPVNETAPSTTQYPFNNSIKYI